MTGKNRPFLFTLMTIALLLVAGNFTGCEPEDWILEANCNDCFGSRPDSANLIVYLSISPENDSVPLTFYRGDSGGEIDWQDTATSDEFSLYSKVGSTYAVRAEYKSGPQTIIAWDSDKMTLKDYGAECGDPCFMIKGGIFDLRLLGD